MTINRRVELILRPDLMLTWIPAPLGRAWINPLMGDTQRRGGSKPCLPVCGFNPLYITLNAGCKTHRGPPPAGHQVLVKLHSQWSVKISGVLCALVYGHQCVWNPPVIPGFMWGIQELLLLQLTSDNFPPPWKVPRRREMDSSAGHSGSFDRVVSPPSK